MSTLHKWPYTLVTFTFPYFRGIGYRWSLISISKYLPPLSQVHTSTKGVTSEQTVHIEGQQFETLRQNQLAQTRPRRGAIFPVGRQNSGRLRYQRVAQGARRRVRYFGRALFGEEVHQRVEFTKAVDVGHLGRAVEGQIVDAHFANPWRKEE